VRRGDRESSDVVDFEFGRDIKDAGKKLAEYLKGQKGQA